MEKMRTILAFLLMVLNTGSLTVILAIAFSIKDVQYDLIGVKIISIVSYLFILSFLSSFCLTEHECCECCCPANKCCLCEKKPKKAGAVNVESSNNKGQKNQDCCAQCCDCLYDCLFIPIGACTRKIGKQGSRYFSVFILVVAHGGMTALCFYAVSKTKEKMNTKTVIIVAICIVMIVANLFAMIAPCFPCCEKLRYQPIEKKNTNKDENNDKYKNDTNVVQVKDALDTALIENKQNNEYNHYNNNQQYMDNGNIYGKNENVNNNFNTGNNTANDFGKVFGVNKGDVYNIKKEE